MDTDRSEVIVYPLPGDGQPYTLVANGEGGVAVRGMPVAAGEEGNAPTQDGGKDPAAAMIAGATDGAMAQAGLTRGGISPALRGKRASNSAQPQDPGELRNLSALRC